MARIPGVVEWITVIDDRTRGSEIGLGILAILFYTAHGSYHWLHGFPQNLLWACHLGSLLVGAGLLVRSPSLNGVGTLWLSLGTPSWLIGLVAGGRFTPTSVLTHVGGLAVGLWGIARGGLPAGVWWKALGGLVLLHVATRPFNPADKNVNFAGGIWKGFEPWFSSHTVFLLATLVICASVLFVFEKALRRLVGSGREKSHP